MRFLTLSLVLGVFAAGTAGADSCRVQQRVVVHHAPVHHAAVAAIVTPIPVATYLPIQVAVPTYSVGVAPQQATQPDAVLGAIEKLTLAVERLGAGQPQSLAATAPVGSALLPHLQVFKSDCARCHDKSVAQAKGGGLVLIDGDREVQLSPKQLLKVLTTSHGDTMPKSGPKLTAVKKKVLSDWVESLVQ